jgi:hypothetical protein
MNYSELVWTHVAAITAFFILFSGLIFVVALLVAGNRS